MGMLKSLGKAALAALATPVGLAGDTLTAPSMIWDTDKKFLGRTEALADKAKENFNDAIKPEKEHG